MSSAPSDVVLITVAPSGEVRIVGTVSVGASAGVVCWAVKSCPNSFPPRNTAMDIIIKKQVTKQRICVHCLLFIGSKMRGEWDLSARHPPGKGKKRR